MRTDPSGLIQKQGDNYICYSGHLYKGGVDTGYTCFVDGNGNIQLGSGGSSSGGSGSGGSTQSIGNGAGITTNADGSIDITYLSWENGQWTIVGTTLYAVYMWDWTSAVIPHTFLQTPNITSGFYPEDSWHYAAAVITSPGQIKNDSRHPRDPSPTHTFFVDASTLSTVEQNMGWNPGLYSLNNGFWNKSYNCTGWAIRVLTNSGLGGSLGWGGVGANPWTNR